MYESPCSPPFCDFVFCDWQPNDRSSPQDSASLKMESFVEPTHPLSNWSRRNSKNFMSHIGSTNKGKVLRASEENIQTFKWAFALLLSSKAQRCSHMMRMWIMMKMMVIGSTPSSSTGCFFETEETVQNATDYMHLLYLKYKLSFTTNAHLCLFAYWNGSIANCFYGVVCLSEDFGYRKVSISSTTQ